MTVSASTSPPPENRAEAESARPPAAIAKPPAAVLVAFDVAWGVLFLVVAGVPAAITGAAFHLLSTFVPWWLQLGLLPAYAIAFLFAMTGVAALVRLALPRVEPGRYPFPKHPMVRAWLLGFALMRILYLPLWRPLMFSIATLRTCALRALGARAPLSINTGSDLQLLDPALLSIGEGALAGAGVVTSAHMIVGGELELARIEVGAGAQLLERCIVGPGATIGRGSVVGAEAAIGPHCTVGDGARIGARVVLLADVSVGIGARVGHCATVGRGARIGSNAIVADCAHVPAGHVVPSGSRFPLEKDPR